MRMPRVAAAQYPITAHTDLSTWAAHVGDWVSRSADADLLVFPEYGSMELLSTFPAHVQGDMTANLSALAPLLERYCETFAALARRHRTTIIAPSLPVLENGRWINRAYVFGPNGIAGWQDKWFMTRFEDEDWGVSASDRILTLFETDWGNFGIQICYDVEFGIGAHHLCAAGAQVIAVPSCTETIRGASRVHVGARARALENQCYVVVAQTVGEAPWSPIVDLNHGWGACYCPPDKGLPEEGVVATTVPNEATWLAAELDLEALAEVRRDGQVLNFRDAGRLVMDVAEGGVVVRKVQVR